MQTLSAFEKLTLKQKLIYCIHLFEEYLIKKKLDGSAWKNVLQILQEINDFEYLDEWFYKYCEILPDAILEENDYHSNKEDWEFIDFDHFKALKALYQDSEETEIINELMKLIHEIASIELYTDSRKVSKRSFKPYLKFREQLNK